MHSKFIRLALFCGFSLLLVHSAIAQITPAPATPPPIVVPPVLDQADPQAASAVIRYGPGYSLNLTPRNDWGRFQKVALQPGQVVTVALQLSPPDFAKSADIQVLDGGAIVDSPLPSEVTDSISTTEGVDFATGKTAIVSVAGQLLFSFRPGNDIGLHRVSVIVGGNQYFFQFWRQNPSAPNNNPSMLRAY